MDNIEGDNLLQGETTNEDLTRNKRVLPYIYIIAAMLLAAVTIGIYLFLTKINITDNSTHNNQPEDEIQTESNKPVEEKDEYTENINPTITVYETEYFPSIQIPYNSTWTLQESVSVEGIPNQDKVTATFSKNNVKIIFTMSTFSSMGDGGFTPYMKEYVEYKVLSKQWTRVFIKETGEYIYSPNVASKNHSPLPEIFSAEGTANGIPFSEYELFVYPNINIETSIPDPEASSGQPHIYSGKLSVLVSISDETLIPEIDNFFESVDYK